MLLYKTLNQDEETNLMLTRFFSSQKNVIMIVIKNLMRGDSIT